MVAELVLPAQAVVVLRNDQVALHSVQIAQAIVIAGHGLEQGPVAPYGHKAHQDDEPHEAGGEERHQLGFVQHPVYPLIFPQQAVKVGNDVEEKGKAKSQLAVENGIFKSFQQGVVGRGGGISQGSEGQAGQGHIKKQAVRFKHQRASQVFGAHAQRPQAGQDADDQDPEGAQVVDAQVQVLALLQVVEDKVEQKQARGDHEMAQAAPAAGSGRGGDQVEDSGDDLGTYQN
ncbi:hypothetical protein ADICEAN_04214 [Cesiribacter andamanensis AMV16]|uniref:Uncharacterized protein n=1 Tax=Cesiribacter andamanensis AMV16 TaxID=1279009 RepID=M7N039_9BACT|nr:hypothetical protein ADICEAN_04214 [Cesiribacter andamanensis AMV16]